jgi:choline dehydrogenase-like flavoprotein
MGTDPATSVTDGSGAFHEVPNAYVAGPALFPQMGSPNPMLTGIALARRTAERINVLLRERVAPVQVIGRSPPAPPAN